MWSDQSRGMANPQSITNEALQDHQKFSSFQVFEDKFKEFKKDTGSVFRIKSSSSVAVDNKRRKTPIPDCFKYGSISYCCVHYGKPKVQGHGVQPKQRLKEIMSEDNTLESGCDSPPQIPIDSPGSSASSRLKEEYSQLLKYTIESTPGLNTILPLLETTDNVQTEQGTPGIDTNRSKFSSNCIPSSTTEELSNESAQRSHSYVNESVAQMNSKLGSWLGLLRENILEELAACLESTIQSQHEENLKANEQIQAEKASLQKEVNRLTEQINNLEHSVQQKCTLVNNLTDSLVAQKKKVELAKHFYHWKADHYDRQREIFTEKLAVQHHERKLNLRVLKSWYGVIQTRWRARTEHKSQTQAKEMCLSLTNDYETKVGMLNEKICALEKKGSLLQAEREMYSEQVKKAFMRGMCALNMETMSVFGEEQLKQSQIHDDSAKDMQEVSMLDTNTLLTSLEDMDSQSESSPVVADMNPKTIPSNTSQSQHSDRSSTRQQEIKPSFASTKSKACKSKSKPARPQSSSSNNNKAINSSQVLAPPMASIVVERHPPVNKQTMGKATAVKYPKKSPQPVPVQYSTTSCPKYTGVGELRFKPLAGQADNRNEIRTVTNSYIKMVD